MLYKLEKSLNKINAPLCSFISNISGFLLLLMTVIVLLQVLFRYILNMPLSWTDEASRFLMIYMTYLCLPLICLLDKNIAMTFVLDKLKGTKLIHLFMLVIYLLSIFLIVIWIYFGWIFFKTGSVKADSLNIPMYYIYIAPPVMMMFTVVVCFQKAINELSLLIYDLSNSTKNKEIKES